MTTAAAPISVDIAIVGAGVVGLTLAAALADSDVRIAVLDQQPAPTPGLHTPYDLRVSAINHAAEHILRAVGVWDAITALRCSSYPFMQVVDQHSPARIAFDASEVGERYLGHILEHSVLRQVLWARLVACKHVRLYPQATPQRLDEQPEHVTLELASGDVITTKLLVGADGAHSWVAQQAGLAVKSAPYHHSAIVTTLRSTQPHQGTAWQRFLTAGPLALLPLADPQLLSLVWSTEPEHADTLCALNDEAFNRAVSEASIGRFGALTAVDKRLLFPLQRRHASNYVKPRIALIGDAAHTIHPLAGQGVNLGLLDAASLAQVIIRCLQRRGDIGGMATLRRYERWRKGENTLMLAAMQGFKQLFTTQHEIIRHARFIGFTLVEKLTWAKIPLMKRAMGLGGDLPDLARG